MITIGVPRCEHHRDDESVTLKTILYLLVIRDEGRKIFQPLPSVAYKMAATNLPMSACACSLRHAIKMHANYPHSQCILKLEYERDAWCMVDCWSHNGQVMADGLWQGYTFADLLNL